ncbi:hypothetical protein PsYK624_053920 [Phanerochaete sordida]|uniref:F-box domain-containing protein n=1 Tax=Phanerochaete sordida TaxID=48140 RepID=A0A9P3G8A5_9APHY|nr:hypothetical protein PsYK624_053920 [Phanerochaete sordida]
MAAQQDNLVDSNFSTRPRTGGAIFGSLRWQGDPDSLRSSFPIGRLLPELLADVFEWYIITIFNSLRLEAIGMEDIFQGARGLEDQPNPYCWLVIRHVCREWRQISLTYPRLSSYICLTRPECVQDLLSKSADVHLHIYTPQLVPQHSVEAYQKSWTLVSDRLFRAVSADLFIPEEGLHPPVGPGRLPSNMEELRVMYGLGRTRDQRNGPFTITTAPLSKLRACTLIHATFQDVSPFLVPSLRCVNLDLLSASSLGDHAAIISMLNSTPNLEELTLRGIGSDWYQGGMRIGPEGMVVAAPPWSLGKKATLPCLREVLLQGLAGEQHFQVLDHIESPPLQVLDLEASAIACTSLYERIAESINRHVRAMPARSAVISLGKDQDRSPGFVVMIYLWSDCHDITNDLKSSTAVSEARPIFSLCVDFTDESFAAQVIRRLRLPTVTTVLFQERGRTAASMWQMALEIFPGTRELQLEYTFPSWPGYHRTHAPPTALWEEGPNSLVTLLPNLQKVHVYMVRHERVEDRCTDFAALAHALEAHFNMEWEELESDVAGTRGLLSRLL